MPIRGAKPREFLLEFGFIHISHGYLPSVQLGEKLPAFHSG